MTTVILVIIIIMTIDFRYSMYFFFFKPVVLFLEPHKHTSSFVFLFLRLRLGVAQEILEMLDNDSSEICEHVLKNAVLTAGEKAAAKHQFSLVVKDDIYIYI